MTSFAKLLGVAALVLLTTGARAANFGDADRARVDAVAAAWVKAGKTPGMVVGIASDGKMLHAKAFGFADIEHNVPMAVDSILRVGSLTKQFTSAALMQLVEQGKVKLDDPIAKFYPDFPRATEVTIRHLLAHTSGIFNYTSQDMPDAPKWRQAYTADEMIKRIAANDPPYDFAPGTAWRYSNSGYFIAGAIVEKASGERLRDYLQKNVIGKAGLSADTALDDDEREVLPRRAEGYDAVPGKPGAYVKGDFIAMSVPGGAGALRATAADLAAWHHALSTGKVVSAKSYAEMIAPGRLRDGRLASEAVSRPAGAPPPQPRKDPAPDYGLGLYSGVMAGHKMISHTGSIQGFNSSLSTFPDDHLTVVVLTNTSNGASVARDIALAALNVNEGR
ncbi:MAG: serine hydrolase domain-containing protein [Rhodospirillaceae bacterium]